MSRFFIIKYILIFVAATVLCVVVYHMHQTRLTTIGEAPGAGQLVSQSADAAPDDAYALDSAGPAD